MGDMITEAKKRVGLVYHWNENEYEVWEKGSDIERGDTTKGWVGDLNIQEDYKEFIAQAPAYILSQQERVRGLLQDKKDLLDLVKIVQLGADDLAESLLELANMVLEYSDLDPRLLERAREAKELVEV